MWYGVREPYYEIPDLPQPKTMKYLGKAVHAIECHIAEVPENGPDLAHVKYLHRPFGFGIEALTYEFHLDWDYDEGDPYKSIMKAYHTLHWFGFKVPFTTVGGDINQHGPSFVQFDLVLPGGAHFFFMQSVTPVNPMLQEVRHIYYIPKLMPVWFGKFLAKTMIHQVERDIKIWN